MARLRRTNESRSFPSRMHNKLRRLDLSCLLTIAQFEKTFRREAQGSCPVAGQNRRFSEIFIRLPPPGCQFHEGGSATFRRGRLPVSTGAALMPDLTFCLDNRVADNADARFNETAVR